MTDFVFEITIILTISIVLIVFFLIRIISSGESEERPDLMDEIKKTALLDFNVRVTHGENTVHLMFGIGVLMISIAVPTMVFTIIAGDDSNLGYLIMGVVLAMACVLVFFFWPFAREGRFYITDNLVVLPVWNLRPLTMNPRILRIENIEYVTVIKKSLRNLRIESLSFHGRVYGHLRLSQKDHDKYAVINDRLRSLGIEVRE
jgi:hypothetical protein